MRTDENIMALKSNYSDQFGKKAKPRLKKKSKKKKKKSKKMGY